MKRSPIFLAAMSTAFLVTTGGALAQQAAPAPGAQAGAASPAYWEVEDDNTLVQPFNLSVEQIEDMDVVGAGGERIGEVEEVLMDGSRQVVAVTVEAGGFLGIGERDVIVGLDHLQLEGGRFATDFSKQQVEALPQWND